MATSNNSSVTLIAKGNIKPNRIAIGGGKGGVSNYELLTHKPSINGHELIGNKTNAELGIPTDTQDLTNTAGFITKIVDDLVNYYTKLEIDDIITEIKQSSFRIVDDLPLVGDPGVIYLILNATPQSRNYYDEYIYTDNRWEKIGTTEIDLSGYVTDEELTQVLRSYITNAALNEALRNYYNKADVNLMLADKANSADLAAVATSGSYNDLQNKPDIPDDLADLNEDTTHRTVTDAEKTAWNNKSDFSGSYNDLTNKPTIPDELADLTDDTTHRLVTDAEKSTWNAKSDFSGSYNDLTNKPTIPDELADLSDDATHRLVTDTEKQIWNNKSDFSGSYNDLTDKPDIPTVYNSTITIQKNNQNIDSFTLNQSSNKSINIDVPEKTSDIQNDSGFITNTVNNLANYYLKSETYTKTEVSNLINAAVSGRFQKVNALPAQGEANVIYLVPKATVLVDNVYDEYIWEDDSWELIGDTQIDLSGYVTDADLTAALQSYVTSATFNTTISNYYTKTEVGNLLADKVDKVDGKGLSTYDYDAAAKAIVDGVTSALNDKVDKVQGKGLSTNDYDNTAKGIVDGVTSALADKVDKVNGKGLSTEDYTTAEKNKLAGIDEGAEVNVQSDWNQTDDTQDDYIKNKPEAYDAIWQNNDLLSGVSDVQPYLYRATNMPDGSIPYIQEKLIGASAAVNQLVDLPSDTYTRPSGIVVTRNSDGSIRFVSNGSNTEDDALRFTQYGAFFNFGFNGHKVLLIPRANKDIAGFIQKAYISPSASWTESKPVIEGKQLTVASIISVPDGYYYFIWYGSSGANLTYDVTLHPMLIDLTQMFGTAIADLAYSKEQASAGSGIAWLKSYGFFTKDYYPYNAGALQSVKTGSKKVVGKNLAKSNVTFPITIRGVKWNIREDGAIIAKRVSNSSNNSDLTYISSIKLPAGSYIGSSFYSGSGASGSTYQTNYIYDGSSHWGVNTVNFTLTEESEVSMILRYYSGYSDEAIFYPMIRKSTESDEWEPYTSTTYPLDSDLELRGLYKLDASNNIVCDGDEYTPDGNVKRRYGIINLGTQNFSWQYIATSLRFYAVFSGAKAPDTSAIVANALCSSKYEVISWTIYTQTGGPDKCCAIADISGTICIGIRDTAYTDPTAFKASLDGVYLIYELATPTIDSAASYQNPQIIHENGTEEFIDTRDYPLPVGHDTGYFTASDEKFFLPPVVDNDGRFLYHDGDGFQFKNFNQVASKVEESDINGNIKINGSETQVYDDSELQGIVDTDTTTATGNPLNFSTKSAQNAVNTDIVIDPVQDLHGYTKPWAGGAGKNKYQMRNTDYSNVGINLTANSDGTVNFSGTATGGNFMVSLFQNTTEITQLFAEGGTFSLSFNKGTYNADTLNISMAYKKPNDESTYFLVPGMPAVVPANSVFTASNLYVANGNTVQSLNGFAVQLEKASSATTYEPYENICPISPKEQITIQGCGKNICPYIELGALDQTTGEEISGNIIRTGFMPVNPNTTYILSGLSGTGMPIRMFDYGKSKIHIRNYIIEGITGKKAFITNNDTYYIRFQAGLTVMSLTSDIQVELGNRATSYEPYNLNTDLQIPLPNDFYGGTLNLETGELVVNWKNVDLGTLDWTYNSQMPRHTFEAIINGRLYDSNRYRMILPQYTYYDDSPNSMPDKSYTCSNNSTVIYIKDDDKIDSGVTNFKQLLSGSIAVYELETPYTIQLTPHQLNLLKATNNISTDAKTISVTYRNGELSTYAPATDIADGLLTATDKRAIDRTSDIVKGNPIQFSTESKQIARSTIIDLEPIQDLHGYSKPWVGGAGKNLLPMTMDGIKSANTSGTWSGNAYTLNNVIFTVLIDSDNNVIGIHANGTANATTVFRLMDTQTSPFTSNMIFNGCPSGGSVTSYYMYFYDQTNDASRFIDSGSGANVDYSTISGHTIRILICINSGTQVTNKIFYPMIRLSTVTDATFEPYTNICPISGYDNIDINGCGENLFDGILESGAIDDTTGQKFPLANRYRSPNYIPVKPNTNYAFSKNGVLQANNIYLYRKDKTYIRKVGYVSTFLTSNETAYVLFYNDNVINVESGLQLEEGSIATPYTPYTESNNISIQLDNTVYGGKLDVEKGELVVDRGYAQIDSVNGVYNSTNNRYITSLTNISKPDAVEKYSEVNCINDKFESISLGGAVTSGVVGVYANASNMGISGFKTSLADYQSWLTNNPVTVCYKIATPTTIQLSPHAINLLKGVNTITTNGTSITLNYRNGEVATLEDVQNLTDLLMKLINNLSS